MIPGGETVLPNGRLLTPVGRRLYTGADLWQLLSSPDGKRLVGIDETGLILYPSDSAGSKERGTRLAAKDWAPAMVFLDNNSLVVSTGEAGGIAWVDLDPQPRILHEVSANTETFKNTYLNDFAISPDRRTLYAIHIAHQRLLTYDLETRKLVSSVAAGRQPYALAMDATRNRLYVANIGIFDYSVIGAPRAGEGNSRGISTPAFGYPSAEARDGVEKEGRRVPGLGDDQSPEAHSVFAYDITQPTQPKIVARQKTGLMIHAPADGGKAVGGSAPCALLSAGDRVWVSNSNNDTVQALDPITLKVRETIKLTPTKELAKLRGVIPSGMTLSADGQSLYVCESGLNALVKIDVKTRKVVGHIPTGWFPMQVRRIPGTKKLAVACQKGLGRGPRGIPRAESDERFGLPEMPGMIQVLPEPEPGELAALSQRVLRNNGLIPVARGPLTEGKKVVAPGLGVPSPMIEHVVFITKENHTFDGIFGELKGARGNADFAHYGRNGWIQAKGRDLRLPIMPNHLKLAEEFAICDNFYMEPQASGDGHRWLVGVYPSLWTTRIFYAGWGLRLDNTAKGRLASIGSDGSQIPEDYLENGSLWEHLHRNGIEFRNYGEGYELPGTDEGWMTNRAGTYYRINHPMPKVLFDRTCFEFPAYNTNIPDIARADWFVEDLQKNYRSNGKPLPKFLNIAICNDHGAGPMPNRGYPYTESFMADNDLALGRIVEWLTQQPEWQKMAIFVTQDDSGGDNDHIDRHRSFVLAISPYSKRGYVGTEHSSIISILKTIYQIFGAGPNNMFDAVTTDLSDLFSTQKNLTGYRHVPVDPRVFKPEDTFDPTDPKFERRRREAAKIKMDDPEYLEQMEKP